jgi:hypothetical protein
MKFQIRIKLSTLRALEATALLCLFAFAVLGAVGAWR